MLANDKKTPVVFTGNAREYFGIWIVNLLLSILTLGIYSAWAKVRRKKYFYQHTLIDGAGFDYHASPIGILKGRLIAFAFFVLYAVSGSISPLLSALLALVFVLFLPWIVVRAMVFNARNSSHRGLRFDFTGTTGEAARVFIFLPILVPFTLGLIYPYISHKRARFLMENHRYGTSEFQVGTKVGDFYVVYMEALLLTAFLGVAGFFALKAIVGSTGGLLSSTAVVGLIIAGYLLAVLISAAFLQAKLGNLLWNGTRLDTLGFHANLKARYLAWLYVSNLLAIVCSFGLLTPWAQVRAVRYHAQCIALTDEVDFERFVGEKRTALKATGDEVAEMFDVDLAFG